MARKSRFKTGDIVRLKSGGPDMTVEKADSMDDQVECQWFAGKKLESGWFPEDSLVPVPEAKDGDGK